MGSRIVMAGAAVLVAMASMSCEPVTDAGVQYVAIAEDGTVVATMAEYLLGSLAPVRSAITGDGGRTWTDADETYWETIDSSVLLTPRGTYAIEDSGILVIDADGRVETAYSTAHLGEESNLWVQGSATIHLGDRRLTTRPSGIVYDAHSGNLIAAMGTEGVVVGTPDGAWMRYAVGPYSPTDLSFFGKTRVLVSSAGFWTTAFVLSLSILGIALILLEYERPGLSFLTSGLAMGTLSCLASGALFVVFGDSDPRGYSKSSIPLVLLAIPAYVLVIMVLANLGQYFRYWRPVVATLAGMNALVFLLFLLWLNVGASLILTKVLTVALLALTGFVLSRYVKRRESRLLR